VEAVFEGDRERVKSMVEWCGRGPAHAEVDEVDLAWELARGEKGFAVHGGWA
jgi:acylphosphatase